MEINTNQIFIPEVYFDILGKRKDLKTWHLLCITFRRFSEFNKNKEKIIAKFIVCEEYYNGSKGTMFKYSFNNLIHNINDQPAIVKPRFKGWYKMGVLHRGFDSNGIQQPAIIDCNGNKRYYIEGKLHRESGPASDLH